MCECECVMQSYFSFLANFSFNRNFCCKSLWQLQRHFTHTICIAYLNSVIPCIAIASCNPKKPYSILVIMITPAGRIPCSPVISFPLSKNLITGTGTSVTNSSRLISISYDINYTTPHVLL